MKLTLRPGDGRPGLPMLLAGERGRRRGCDCRRGWRLAGRFGAPPQALRGRVVPFLAESRQVRLKN